MRTTIITLLLITACTTTTTTTPLTEEQAITACIKQCEQTRTTTTLDSECLGNLDDEWVCDVAHNPRQDQDNLVDNQCGAYRAGTHLHFVEVTPECELIRAR